MYVVGEPRVHLRAQMCVSALHFRARPRVAANPARIDIAPTCLGTTRHFREILEMSMRFPKNPENITRRPRRIQRANTFSQEFPSEPLHSEKSIQPTPRPGYVHRVADLENTPGGGLD